MKLTEEINSLMSSHVANAVCVFKTIIEEAIQEGYSKSLHEIDAQPITKQELLSVLKNLTKKDYDEKGTYLGSSYIFKGAKESTEDLTVLVDFLTTYFYIIKK